MKSHEALALRKRLRLTQQAFWGRIGVSQSSGSRLEAGNRRISKPVSSMLILTHSPKKKADRFYKGLRRTN